MKFSRLGITELIVTSGRTLAGQVQEETQGGVTTRHDIVLKNSCIIVQRVTSERDLGWWTERA